MKKFILPSVLFAILMTAMPVRSWACDKELKNTKSSRNQKQSSAHASHSGRVAH